MLVLIDLEWTIRQKPEKELTQISAVRVDKSWNIHSEFHRTICPGNPEGVDWQHIAYNGYSGAYFLNSPEEHICIADFRKWLRKDDVLCSWAYSVSAALKEVWVREFGEKPKQTLIFSNARVYDKLSETDTQTKGLYPVAQHYGISPLHPEHCAKNDAYMMLAVFRVLFARTDLLCENRILANAARNTAMLQKTSYRYIYTPTSSVFHQPGCKRALQANEIIGCERYKTACRKRRPCKLCKPMPPEPAVQTSEPERPVETLQKIRLLDQSVVLTYPHKIVGCCHNWIHPGKMTRKLMEAHDCLGKQCSFFEKYASATYWEALRQKQEQRQKQKQKKRQEKANAQAARMQALELVDELQGYAELCAYEIEIIDIKQERKNLYKVFYVSNLPYPDGKLYPGLVERAVQAHPKWKLLLRHIKDEAGRFVTIQEFYARKCT